MDEFDCIIEKYALTLCPSDVDKRARLAAALLVELTDTLGAVGEGAGLPPCTAVAPFLGGTMTFSALSASTSSSYPALLVPLTLLSLDDRKSILQALPNEGLWSELLEMGGF